MQKDILYGTMSDVQSTVVGKFMRLWASNSLNILNNNVTLGVKFPFKRHIKCLKDYHNMLICLLIQVSSITFKLQTQEIVSHVNQKKEYLSSKCTIEQIKFLGCT